MCSLRNFITLHEISRNAARRFGYWILLASLSPMATEQCKEENLSSTVQTGWFWGSMLVSGHPVVHVSSVSSDTQNGRFAHHMGDLTRYLPMLSRCPKLSQAVPSCPPVPWRNGKWQEAKMVICQKKLSASYRLQILRLGCFRLWGFPKS